MDRRALRAKFVGMRLMLTERSRRRWAATEARALGHGGIAAVASAISARWLAAVSAAMQWKGSTSAKTRTSGRAPVASPGRWWWRER